LQYAKDIDYLAISSRHERHGASSSSFVEEILCVVLKNLVVLSWPEIFSPETNNQTSDFICLSQQAAPLTGLVVGRREDRLRALIGRRREDRVR
jgi:hypothetical protein